MAGFRPIRHLTGGAGGCFKTRRFQKDTSDDGTAEIFPGDPLTLAASGLVRRMNPTSGASTPAQRACVGIAARVVADAEGKPKTFEASGKGTYSTTAASDWIEVYVDPGIVYEATFHASAGQTEIGSLVHFSAHASFQNSAAGQSGYVVQAAASATNDTTFRIVDISPRSLDQTTDKGSSTGLVEVVINSHAFGQNQAAI